MARRGALALFVIGLALPSIGCRQILGLKRAVEEQTPDAGDKPVMSLRGVPTPGVACEGIVSQRCLDCRQSKCKGGDTHCLSDPACRKQLDAYAVCLGPRGCAGDAEACWMQVSDTGLKACLLTCNSECARDPLVSPCELYCACMKQCPNELVGADCMTTCEAWPAEVRNCRRDHCEWGAGDTTHCKHASGAVAACMSYEERAPSERTHVCLSGNESTWSCTNNSDCCSEQCSNGVCL